MQERKCGQMRYLQERHVVKDVSSADVVGCGNAPELQKQGRHLAKWESTETRELFAGSPAQISGARAANTLPDQCRRRRRRSGRLPRWQVHQQRWRCSQNCEGCLALGRKIDRRGRREGGGTSTLRNLWVAETRQARMWRCAARAARRSCAVVQPCRLCCAGASLQYSARRRARAEGQSSFDTL